MSFWDPDEDGYEESGVTSALDLWLRDELVPGYAEVDCDVAAATDERKPAGANAGRIVVHGRRPVELSIRVQLWTPRHATEWARLLPLVAPHLVRRQSAEAVSIVHSSLAGLGVGSVLITSCSNLRPGSVPGSRTVALRAVEWSGARPVTATRRIVKAAAVAKVAALPAFAAFGSFADGSKGLVQPPANTPAKPSATTPPPST